MSKLFSQGTGTKAVNLESKYNKSIANLLLVVIFTVINIVLLVLNANSYFLFSAFIPYFAVDYGMFFCGMYPEDFYADMTDFELLDSSFLYFTIAVAVVILLFYLVSWYFAKKKKLWALICALVLFTVDTLAMFALTGFSTDSIIDIIFHIWVIVYLIIAINTFNKIKKSPAEPIPEQAGTDMIEINSSPLRAAEDVKNRVFLETDAFDMHIIYRRVKHTNELIVNGFVYDEYEALAEFAHTLIANVNGHQIEAIYDGSYVKIIVDTEEKAKKIRIL